jgi:uncharacterized protein (TIGR02145 family)
MIIGYLNNIPQKIAIKRPCQGYYLRWWYNGWHYWFFKPGKQSLNTEGEKYRTIGTKSISIGTGQITYDQCSAIRTIMNTREVYIFTSDGWKNISIAPGSLVIFDNQVNGYEVELSIKIGSKEISVTGFSPVEIIPNDICNWFLPSQDEVLAMYNELHLYAVGGFASAGYWTSSETSAIGVNFVSFSTGAVLGSLKSASLRVRSCRAFTSTKNYNLRDIGEAGGFVFWKSGNNYLEASPTDLSQYIWSNITNEEIGTTGTAIGTGQSNTLAIINQTGNANDWYLPSRDELIAIYTELKAKGIGGFRNSAYWSSSESNATNAIYINFSGGGAAAPFSKAGALFVAVCRFFTSVINYNLGDGGPAGGNIFWKSGNNYLEGKHLSTIGLHAWSNITNAAIGITNTGIGTGLANSNAIVGQASHIDSAAKECLDHDNSYIHIDSAAKICDDYCSEPDICGITIGSQIWMCKNYDSAFPGSKVYNDDEANRTLYGGLYTYSQVNTPGFCPNGWHVPTLDEWNELITYLGGIIVAGGHLKEAGLTYWGAPNTDADNSSGFGARAGGGYINGVFFDLKITCWMWAVNPAYPNLRWYASVYKDNGNANANAADPYDTYRPVRLIRNWAAIIPLVTYDDWFLPSRDGLNAMYTELHLHGVGSFDGSPYWSSSENDATITWLQTFSDGSQSGTNKNVALKVRACRAFTSTTNYSLRDIGPAGGYIFWKAGNDYLEAAPTDQSSSQAWSNITAVAVTGTGTAIGTGQANTTAIIGQVGHTDSAAKLCNDLVILH